MTEGSNIDYWFLRENGIPAKIALRMLAIAYKTEKRVVEDKDERKRIREIQNRHFKEKVVNESEW